MHFTRDPIIETVITPRDGHRLLLQNLRDPEQEPYLVDAIEVISFGHSFFYRSLERPRPFLVPIAEYELVEVKETKMALKLPGSEQAIKIAGGKDAQPPRREERNDSRPSRKDRRKKGRQERGDEVAAPIPEREELPATDQPVLEEEKPASFISKLFPPPSMLIKDTIGRYKTMEVSAEEAALVPPLEESPVLFDESLPLDREDFPLLEDEEVYPEKKHSEE